MPNTELCPPVSPTKTSRRHLILPLGCTAVLFILLVVLRDGGTKGHLLASYGLFWVFYIGYVISGTKTNPVVYFVPALIVVAEFITPFRNPVLLFIPHHSAGSSSPNPTLVQTFRRFRPHGRTDEEPTCFDRLVPCQALDHIEQSGERISQLISMFNSNRRHVDRFGCRSRIRLCRCLLPRRSRQRHLRAERRISRN